VVALSDAIVAVLVPEPEELYTPLVSSGLAVLAPFSSYSVQVIVAVLLIVEVNTGAASVPVAVLTHTAALACAVPVPEVLDAATRDDQPVVLLVIAAALVAPVAVTAATSRFPAVRVCPLPHEPVTLPEVARTSAGVPTLVTDGGAGAPGRISASAKIWLPVPELVNPRVIAVLAVDSAEASIAASVPPVESAVCPVMVVEPLAVRVTALLERPNTPTTWLPVVAGVIDAV
jgi:hypothetical protein